MTTKVQYTQETLPEILTAAHIASYLSISRWTVYELFKMTVEAGGIKSFNIGDGSKTSKRVMKEDLFNWINAKKDSKTKRTG